MKTMTRWDHFRELLDVSDRLGRYFGRAPVAPEAGREAMTMPEWAPLVDITEDEKEFLIKAELPEVRKEEVKVSVEDGMLTLTGERKMEKEDKGKKYHRVERAYGMFMRSFALPENTDPAKVAAEFKDGVLTVRLPKAEAAKPRAVEVKVT
jgi:HSP20 family protein